MTTAATTTDCDECDEQAADAALFADFATVTAADEDTDDVIEATGGEKPDPRGRKVTRWRGPLAPIGAPTGDKRRFANNSLVNRELPVALKWQRTDNQGHSTSVVIGTVDGITYADDGAPYGTGLLFTPDPEQLPRLAEDVREAKALLEQRVIGPSVDLDDMEFRVDQPEGEMSADVEPGQPERRPSIEVTKGRISAVTLVPIPAFAQAPLELYEVDAAGDAPALAASAVRTSGWQDMPVADPLTGWDPVGAAERLASWAADIDAYGQAFLWRDLEDADDRAAYRFPIADVDAAGNLVIVPQAVTAALGILASQRLTLPDHDRRQLSVQLEEIAERIAAEQAGAVVASSVPATPPAAWFADPKLTGPTPLTITEDGRVYGHLAAWGTCHTGMPGACVTPPKSHTSYAYFHTGEAITDSGAVSVGRISLGGGHADTRLGFRAASDHYDSTSACVATVRAGQDKHGIWIAGSLVPGVDEYKVAELRRSPLSGDWRRVGGQLELVHALAVNSPGFPVPRASMVAGAQQALVAAGALQVGASPAGLVASSGPADIAKAIADGIAGGLLAYRQQEAEDAARRGRERDEAAFRVQLAAEAEEERQQAAARLLSRLEGDFAASDDMRARAEAQRLLSAF